jgi:Zinc knuckle
MKLKVDRDVNGLMNKLKAIAFSKSTKDEPFTVVVETVKRIAALQQGTHESVINYYKRFLTVSEVLEEQWGVFGPPVLATSNRDADLKAAKDKFLGRLFLMGADKRRFSKLMDALHNSFQAGTKDDYPVSLEATVNLLSNYQDHQVGGGRSDEGSGNAYGSSFAMKTKKSSSKIRCFECNEYGHMKKDCPNRAVSNAQHEDQRSTTGSGGGTVYPWSA